MTKAYWMTRYFFSSNGVIGKVNLEPTIYIQLTACVRVCVRVCVCVCASTVQKVMRRSQHARKETEFLRLKRTRLGLDDFESLKVIGRGAFGEVPLLIQPTPPQVSLFRPLL